MVVSSTVSKNQLALVKALTMGSDPKNGSPWDYFRILNGDGFVHQIHLSEEADVPIEDSNGATALYFMDTVLEVIPVAQLIQVPDGYRKDKEVAETIQINPDQLSILFDHRIGNYQELITFAGGSEGKDNLISNCMMGSAIYSATQGTCLESESDIDFNVLVRTKMPKGTYSYQMGYIVYRVSKFTLNDDSDQLRGFKPAFRSIDVGRCHKGTVFHLHVGSNAHTAREAVARPEGDEDDEVDVELAVTEATQDYDDLELDR